MFAVADVSVLSPGFENKSGVCMKKLIVKLTETHLCSVSKAKLVQEERDPSALGWC